MKRILIGVVGSAAAVATMTACGYTLKPAADAAPATDGVPASSQPAPASNDAQGNDNGNGNGNGQAAASAKKVLTVNQLAGLGPVVTSGTGRTVYRFDNDSPKPPTSACSGDCTKTWEPVLAGAGVEIRGGGVDTKLIGTLDRPEGKQVTLKGWPLYYYVDDLELGQTKGQGLGGVWFAISPKGGKAAQNGAQPAQPGKPAKTDKDVQTLTVNTVDGFMSFVTNEKGRTVYRFDKDTPKPPTTTCFGPCAKNWEPVLAGKKGIKLVGGRIDAKAIGTIDRPEGKHVTLNGWPLYYFQADKKLGEVSGYGTGNVWFPIAPNGKKALRCA